jgi:hypothetical protein
MNSLGTWKHCEGHAVRVVPTIGLMALCLGLAGCSLFGKKGPAAANAGRPDDRGPLWPGDRAAVPPGNRSVPSPEFGGVLAGQVVDSFNRRPPAAYIQVAEMRESAPSTAAPIEVAADSQGYFYIQGLQPGRHYQLTARARDGNRYLAGGMLAIPPNSRLLITISEDLARATTPPLPPITTWPGNDTTPKPSAPANEDRPASIPPAPASNGTPSWAPGQEPARRDANPIQPRSYNTVVPPPTPPSQVRPDRIANDDKAMAQGPPPVSIPGQSGQWGPGASRPSSDAPARVPSCVLTGDMLFNFALNDVNGQPWEYRLNHRGRLTLLDFWQTTCLPCRSAMKWHLIPWQKQYGPYGLEIIGIAYEQGPVEDQVRRVNKVRSDLQVNYPILLGAPYGQCPVATQFGAQRFPTLVLLDENGRILWRSEGLDQQGVTELELIFEQRLAAR